MSGESAVARAALGGFRGDCREQLLSSLRRFSYSDKAVQAFSGIQSGRAINRAYQEKLVGLVCGKAARSLFLPAPLQAAWAVVTAVPYVLRGLGCLIRRQMHVELLDGLRQIAPYVIVDCGSYIANDILSAVALMEADSILRLANCDPKSVNYFASQLPLLDGPEWDMDKQYKVASNVKPYQAADHIGKVLGDTAFVLPYSQELEEPYLAGNLLADLTLKDSRPFRKELERIIAEVF